MNIIAIDDEELLLWRLDCELKLVFPNENITCFNDISELLKYTEKIVRSGENIHYAFLDIQLSNGTGLEIAKKLREAFPNIKIIFCTAFFEYAMDAFKLYANGYLLKPIRAEQIRELINTIEFANEKKAIRVTIHTFGNFDVFVDGKLIVFTKSKAKELLAYLVDRNGASVSSSEIGAVLWEDESDSDILKDRVQHVKKDLRDTLSKYGVENILVSGWNSLAIDKSQVSCDYYDFLNGNSDAQKYYLGEYMANYSWSEETSGALSFSKQKISDS